MDKQIIFVFGMHRSGTSCLAGMLRSSGVHVGPVKEESVGNPKGNQEIRAVWQLNNRLLQASQGSWQEPVMVDQWTDADRQDRDRILDEFAAAGRWLLKDPRLMFTLPFWLEGIDRDPIPMGTFRHPTLVCKSLERRDGTPLPVALATWKAYNRRLLTIARQACVPLVRFDLPAQRYRQSVASIMARLNLHLSETDGFFEDHLRSSETPTRAPDAESSAIYDELVSLSEHPGDQRPSTLRALG